MNKVIIKINNSNSEIINAAGEAVEAIDKICKISYPEFKWDYKNKRYIVDSITEKKYFDGSLFPTGWTGDIVRVLKFLGISYKIEDNRVKPKSTHINYRVLDRQGNSSELRYYQRHAIEVMKKAGRGVIHHPTRTGKTVTMAAFAFEIGNPTLILVNDTTVLNQTHAVVSRMSDEEIGIIGDKNWNPKRFTISTVQTLISRLEEDYCKEFLNSIKTLLLDETHHINFNKKGLYNSYFVIAQKCNAYYKFGFTASPGKPGNKEFKLLKAATGKIIDYRSVRELKKAGYLVPAIAYMIKIPHMVSYNNVRQAKVEGVFNNPRRNAVIKKAAETAAKHGKSILISCTEIEQQGKILEGFIPNAVSLYGKDVNGRRTNKKDRSTVFDRFESKKDLILISTLLNEGIDLPAMDVVFNASGYAKERATIQIGGRVLTTSEGKSRAVIFDCYDEDSGRLEKWSKNRMKVYKQLNFKVKMITSKEIDVIWKNQ